MDAITSVDAYAKSGSPHLAILFSHFCQDQQKPDTFELMALQSYFDNIAYQERDLTSRKRKAALELSEALRQALLLSARLDNDFLDSYLSFKHAEREIIIRYVLPNLN